MNLSDRLDKNINPAGLCTNEHRSSTCLVRNKVVFPTYIYIRAEINIHSFVISAMDGGEWSASHPGRFVFVGIPSPPAPIENEAVWAPRVDLNPGTSCPQGSYYTYYIITAHLCTKYDCILGCWRELYYTRCIHLETGTVILVVCPFYINKPIVVSSFTHSVMSFAQLMWWSTL
jgi:hypothetical protein